MKKILVVLLSLAIFVGISVSTASAGSYFSGNIGAVILNDDDLNGVPGYDELTFDTGGVASLAFGTDVGDAGRIEVELAARVNDFDAIKIDNYSAKLSVDGDVTSISCMGNGYFDFKNESRFTPFVGGGLGYAHVEYDFDKIGGSKSNLKDSDDLVAYQVMLGSGFAMTDHLSVDLQYRYFATVDPEIDGADVEYQTHNVMLGLRYSF